ncbi:MAG: response regulator [Curvibacter sp.]|nr:response regulator [Curvibacter sp.]
MQPLKFLIVDDSRAMQAIIRRSILTCGYPQPEIRTAADGEQALDMIEGFQPHLVITDWHMPKVSGLEMLQALRQLQYKNIRVGFITTEKTEALLNEAKVNGAVFILHKPFEDRELQEAVSTAVSDLLSTVADEPAATATNAAPVAPSPETADADADQAQNAPEPAERPAALSGPVPEAALKAVLTQTLGQIPFRLVAGDKFNFDKLTPVNFLGLYAAQGSKGIHAIVVMDSNAVCMVGGGASRRLPPEVRGAMAAYKPDEAMLQQSNHFLEQSARCLAADDGAASLQVSLAKTSLVKNTFAKLAEVMAQTEHRSDFRLSIPGYGEGRIAFFLMQP